ncbi:MAG: class I SAM-dependent methyltransferase [Candidatus Omnitrophica bacterium]|nr:class I SAM-dependent methyltransferase [Candidatus Omnitrophota bacterium]
MTTHFDERIIPQETSKGIISLHLARYKFASPYCDRKRVLDIACGAGYGTSYLSQCAASLVGVDLSADAIAYAKKHYAKDNSVFYVMDACSIQLDEGTFDAVCSFETIEHLSKVEDYLKGITRVLKPDGIYIVSTPHVKKTNPSPENPFHVVEWSPEDFTKLLSRYFSSVVLFGQTRRQSALHRFLQKADFLRLRQKLYSLKAAGFISKAVRTTPFNEMELQDFEFRKNDFRHAQYIVGVCQGPRK